MAKLKKKTTRINWKKGTKEHEGQFMFIDDKLDVEYQIVPLVSLPLREENNMIRGYLLYIEYNLAKIPLIKTYCTDLKGAKEIAQKDYDGLLRGLAYNERQNTSTKNKL